MYTEIYLLNKIKFLKAKNEEILSFKNVLYGQGTNRIY